MANNLECLKKIKVELPKDPAIPLLGIRFDGKGNCVTVIVNRSDKPYEHKKRSENLVADLFDIDKKATELPPMTAGVWENK